MQTTKTSATVGVTVIATIKEMIDLEIETAATTTASECPLAISATMNARVMATRGMGPTPGLPQLPVELLAPLQRGTPTMTITAASASVMVTLRLPVVRSANRHPSPPLPQMSVPRRKMSVESRR